LLPEGEIGRELSVLQQPQTSICVCAIGFSEKKKKQKKKQKKKEKMKKKKKKKKKKKEKKKGKTKEKEKRGRAKTKRTMEKEEICGGDEEGTQEETEAMQADGAAEKPRSATKAKEEDEEVGKASALKDAGEVKKKKTKAKTTKKPAGSSQDPSDEQEFLRALCCLLARYEALSGSGYQAAVPRAGFRVLREAFGVRAECFASPLNCCYARFWSAFGDTDEPFGSLGSFFRVTRLSGSYEANPPFVPELMLRMVDRFEDLLSHGSPLSFAIFVPSWPSLPFYKRLESSKYLRRSTVLKAKDHAFCDGAQHVKRQMHRPSSFDTGIFVLQNKEGADKWPISKEIMTKLTSAMLKPKGLMDLADYERSNRRKHRHHQQNQQGKKMWKKQKLID